MKKYLLFIFVLQACNLFAQPNFQWVKNITTATAQNATVVSLRVSIDGQHVYLAIKDIGSSTNYSLLKYTADGTLLWKKPIPDNILTLANIEIDNNDQLLVAGWEYYQGIRLKKFDSSGAELWHTAITGFYIDGDNIAIDAANNIYLPARKNTGGQADSAMIKKISPAGAFLQNSAPFFFCHYFALKANGTGLYVTGRADVGTATTVFGKIGNVPLTINQPSWFYGNFLAHFTPALDLDWVQTSAASSSTFRNDIDLDANGDVYVTWLEKEAGVNGFNAKLKKYSSSATLIDSIMYPRVSTNPPYRVLITDSNIVVARNPLYIFNTNDTIQLYKYNKTLQLQKTIPAIADNLSFASIARYKNDLYIAGTFNDASGAASFDGLPVSTNANTSSVYDLFLAKTGTASVLPVQFIEFTATRKVGNILLTWKTANEINNSHFNIQKSADARNFHTIATVPSANEISHTYTLTDKDENRNTVYYRLQQVDKDGKLQVSKVITVQQLIIDGIIKLYPNPATDVVHITVTDVAAAADLRITDAAGKTIYQKTIATAIDIPLSTFPRGTYIVTVRNGGYIESKKLIVK